MIFFITLFLVGCNVAFGTKPNATVELAIVCDQEFSEYFHFNETKLREYWVTRLFDANLKFKTLPSVDVRFVVTSLTIIKVICDNVSEKGPFGKNDKANQSFIEDSRDSNGKVSIVTALEKFSQWLTDSEKQKGSSFDYGLLALGAETNSAFTGKSYVAGACKTDAKNRKIGTGLVRLVKENWWNNCNNLEVVLAITLGAFGPSKSYPDECTTDNFIKLNQCTKNQYFFPSCVDKDISDFVRNASCLHRIDVKNGTMFSRRELEMQPPSIQEQCGIQINNSMAWVNKSDEYQCSVTNCYLRTEDGTLNVAQKLYPFDNSPCEDNKSCFRGRCIPNSFTLVNVASSKCLQSTNPFSSNDTVGLVSCSEVSSPLDRFIVTTTSGGKAVALLTPYSSENATENSDKCLTYDVTSASETIGYSKCYQVSSYIPSTSEWELLSLENDKNEFLIRHKLTQKCVVAEVDQGNAVLSYSCDKSNNLAIWKFETVHEVSREIFLKYFNVFPTTTTTNSPDTSNTGDLTGGAKGLSISIFRIFTMFIIVCLYIT